MYPAHSLSPFESNVVYRLLVLSSETRRLPVTFSLTTPVPQATAGEVAISDLLNLVHNPRAYSNLRMSKFKNSPGFQTRTSTFLSGALPRDRRGRVALKGKNPLELAGLQVLGNDDDPYGEDTPRIGPSSYVVDLERERERDLEALRFFYSCMCICPRANIFRVGVLTSNLRMPEPVWVGGA